MNEKKTPTNGNEIIEDEEKFLTEDELVNVSGGDDNRAYTAKEIEEKLASMKEQEQKAALKRQMEYQAKHPYL